MDNEELYLQLKSVLSAQLKTFTQLEKMQNEILRLIRSQINFQELMTLLNHKEKMVMGVAQISAESRPLIAEWLQRKEELMKEPFYAEMDRLLDEISQRVEAIKKMDEEMTAILNPPRDEDQNPEDLLNAYRALL